MELIQIASLALSFVIGIIGGIFGAYVGMKVGIAKLEIWREITQDAIDGLQKDVRSLNEDSLMHDLELAGLLRAANQPRAMRQRHRLP
jgi:hypothetical protein